MKKIGSHRGFRRLAWLIAAVAFLVTYLTLWVVEESSGSVRGDEPIVFAIVSVLVAGIVWGLVKGTYWVIDGFRNPGPD